MRVHFAIAGQDSHAVLDPSMATPSSLDAMLRGIVIDGEADGARQSQRMDVYATKITVRPAAAQKVDAEAQATIEGWRSAQQMPDGTALAMGAKRLTGTASLTGLDRSHADALRTALVALANAPTPERKDRMAAAVAASRGLLDTLQVQETIEGLQVAVAGRGNVEIDRLQIGWNGAAPDGALSTGLTVGLDGLAIPDLPATTSGLAPRHVALGLSLAGVPTGALDNLILAALAPGADTHSISPQIDALFADAGKTGGPKLGIDALDFDVGPAQVKGHGSVIALSPTDLRGTARVTVTGFDALADRMRDDPQLQQALPFMIVARGLARTEGGTLVWDIVFTPDGVTVNGVDPRTLAQPRPHRPPRQP